MGKRPKRSRHRPGPPPWANPPPVALSPAYEREVQESTRRLERRYQQARRRADRAEARLAQAHGHRARARLQAEVELRRAELAELERMMQAAPAGTQHRGTRSYRPVPVTRDQG
jgi:hypothetical protein